MDRNERLARIKERMTRVNNMADALTRALDLPPEAKVAVLTRLYSSPPHEIVAIGSVELNATIAFIATVEGVEEDDDALAAGGNGVGVGWTMPLTVSRGPAASPNLPQSLAITLSQIGAGDVHLRLVPRGWFDLTTRIPLIIALPARPSASVFSSDINLAAWVAEQRNITVSVGAPYEEVVVATPGRALTIEEQAALSRIFHMMRVEVPSTEL